MGRSSGLRKERGGEARKCFRGQRKRFGRAREKTHREPTLHSKSVSEKHKRENGDKTRPSNVLSNPRRNHHAGNPQSEGKNELGGGSSGKKGSHVEQLNHTSKLNEKEGGPPHSEETPYHLERGRRLVKGSWKKGPTQERETRQGIHRLMVKGGKNIISIANSLIWGRQRASKRIREAIGSGGSPTSPKKKKKKNHPSPTL